MEFLLGKMVSMIFIGVKNADEEEFNCDIIFEHLLDCFSLIFINLMKNFVFKLINFERVMHTLLGVIRILRNIKSLLLSQVCYALY